ncbi:MAG: hypothetical protein MZV64_60410 [Ignavibacteriales bacterium]|nr:hypothetical protein [Ignavibacteriales bacterium]
MPGRTSPPTARGRRSATGCTASPSTPGRICSARSDASCPTTSKTWISRTGTPDLKRLCRRTKGQDWCRTRSCPCRMRAGRCWCSENTKDFPIRKSRQRWIYRLEPSCHV